MKSKISLFKKGLIISDFKRFWWISACYTLALLFILPLNHYMQITNNFNTNNKVLLKNNITRELIFDTYNRGVSPLLLLIVPVLIGALIFRYMQKGRSVSLYHSLPLTRTGLYLNSLVSSLILFIAPLIFNTLVMLLLNGFSPLGEYYSAALIFKWLLYSLLFGILFLSMTVFTGMFTGNSIAQIAFVYILNLLPSFLIEFIRMHLSKLLYGFNDYPDMTFLYKMPVIILFFNRYEHFSTGLILSYIILTLVLFAAGLMAFKIRRPETAGDIITFRPVKPVFIFGITVCAMLLGSTYFIELSNSSLPFIIFGYFICSFISYVIAQMVTNKTFKILHTWKGYLGFALVLILLLLGVKFDILGYVNKIPDPAQVKEVYMGYNVNLWHSEDSPAKYGNSDTSVYYTSTVYRDAQNINNITRLHKLILDNRSIYGPTQFIAYELKNGQRIIRRYAVNTDLYASALGPMYESKEYKESRFHILKQETSDIKYIEIADQRAQKVPVVISDKASLESLKTALRKDIDKLEYSSLATQSQRSLYINIVDLDERRVTYEIRSDYTNTINWIKGQGIYDNVILKPEEVIAVILNYFGGYDANYGKPSAQAAKNIEITDRNVIKELVELSANTDYSNEARDFDVTFVNRNNSHFMGFSMSFNQKVSPELQSYIDKIK